MRDSTITSMLIPAQRKKAKVTRQKAKEEMLILAIFYICLSICLIYAEVYDKSLR